LNSENSEKFRKKEDSKDVSEAKEKYVKKEEVKDDEGLDKKVTVYIIHIYIEYFWKSVRLKFNRKCNFE